MQIVTMEIKHLKDILKVEKECFKKPWTEEMFKEEMSGKFSVYRVITENDVAVGYMGMWILADEGHITNVAIGKDFRRKGYASALVDSFIKLGEERKLSFLTLEVRESNESAISLYEKKGFTPVGRRKNYYENTEDAILMTKFY